MRKIRLGAILVTMAAVIFFGICASSTWAQKGSPVKIGFIAPLSGGFAQVGKDMADGFRLYFDEIGYQAAGRKIELIVDESRIIL